MKLIRFAAALVALAFCACANAVSKEELLDCWRGVPSHICPAGEEE